MLATSRVDSASSPGGLPTVDSQHLRGTVGQGAVCSWEEQGRVDVTFPSCIWRGCLQKGGQ